MQNTLASRLNPTAGFASGKQTTCFAFCIVVLCIFAFSQHHVSATYCVSLDAFSCFGSAINSHSLHTCL